MSFTQDEEHCVRVNVTKWLEINNEKRELNTQLKTLRASQKIVENEIIRSMKEKEIPRFELPDGRVLNLQRTDTKKTVSAKWLKSEFNTLLHVNDAPADIESFVAILLAKISERPSTTRESLKYK